MNPKRPSLQALLASFSPSPVSLFGLSSLGTEDKCSSACIRDNLKDLKSFRGACPREHFQQTQLLELLVLNLPYNFYWECRNQAWEWWSQMRRFGNGGIKRGGLGMVECKYINDIVSKTHAIADSVL